MAEHWLTRLEAAAYLKVHPITLDRWVKDGLIIRHQIVGTQQTRYRASELDAMMQPLAPDHKMPTRGAATRAREAAQTRR